MAVLNRSTQRTLRARLSTFLKDRSIEDLVVRAETVEVEPVDGYQAHRATGRFFVDITVKNKL